MVSSRSVSRRERGSSFWRQGEGVPFGGKERGSVWRQREGVPFGGNERGFRLEATRGGSVWRQA